jgi:hypothetical protein
MSANTVKIKRNSVNSYVYKANTKQRSAGIDSGLMNSDVLHPMQLSDTQLSGHRQA